MNSRASVILIFLAISLAESYQQTTDYSHHNNSIHNKWLHLHQIEIYENLEPNVQIANLTRLIHSELSNILNVNDSTKLYKIELVKLKDKSEYFFINSKEISFDSFLINKIDLHTTENTIDREILCPFTEACHQNVTLNVKLHEINNTESILEFNCTLPIEIKDINDNLPSFFQDKIRIDIDLDNAEVWSSGSIQIPLKAGYDLDSTESNRIHNYTLQPMSPHLFYHSIKYEKLSESLLITLNTTKAFMKEIQSKPVQKFQITSTDGSHFASQSIEINFLIKDRPESIFQKNFYNLTSSVSKETILLNIPLNPSRKCLNYEFAIQTSDAPIISEFFIDKNNSKLNLRITAKEKGSRSFAHQFKLLAKCNAEDITDIAFVIVNLVDISQRIIKNAESSIYLNIVSALNNLAINQTKENSAVYELSFNRLFKNSTSINKEFITVSYLIGANRRPLKSEFNLEVTNEMPFMNSFFEIEEMRNGLYAFKLKKDFYERLRLFRANEENSFDFTIGLKLSLKKQPGIDSSITRFILFKVPKSIVQEIASTTVSSALKSKNIETTESATIPTEINKEDLSLDFVNSVVLITILSVFLILIGLTCFVVSLTLYVLNKCRSKKAEQLNKSDKKFSRSIFNSSQLIDNDAVSNSESGIASGTQTRSTSSSSSSSLMQQSLSESLGTKKNDEIDDANIMVYDVMPSQQLNQSSIGSVSTTTKKLKPNIMDRIYRKTNEIFLSKEKMTEQKIYSISNKSDTSSINNCSNLSANNISPVTTTTVTSSENDTLTKKQNKCITSLYQIPSENSDDSKRTEKDIIYEWFMSNLSHSEPQNHSPKAPQLISTSSQSIAPSISAVSTPTTTTTTINSLLNETSSKNYRNEIYRNSHLILKNYSNPSTQFYKQNPKSNEDSEITTYEARLMNLNELASNDDLLINQNSKLDQNFLNRPPPPMPPTRLDSYLLASNEMSNVQNFVKIDDDGQISSV